MCLKFGRTRAWLRRNMSGREFSFWRVYYAQRPWDAEGSFHIPIAQLSTMFANANRGKNSSAAKLSDFLPFRRAVIQDDDDFDSQIRQGKW